MNLRQNPSQRSYLLKLCSCCFFPLKRRISSQKGIKSFKNDNNLKESLLPKNENPVFDLKPKLKQKANFSINTDEKFKKTLCNCEFLKELNRNNELFFIENTSHYDKLLSNKKMNPEKKKRLSENFKVLNSLNKYPKNRVFLLKYNNSGILCKISYQNFKFPFAKKKFQPTRSLTAGKTMENSNENSKGKEVKIVEEFDEKLNLFSKYHQGIKIDSDSFEKILPEKVSNYLAKKHKKNSLIIDGICGIGTNAIQVFLMVFLGFFQILSVFSLFFVFCLCFHHKKLAIEGNSILAFETNEQRVNFLINNSKIYGVRENIDIIKGNFEDFRGGKKVDLIFLAMEYENMRNSNENFCLFSNLFPNIRKTVENSMAICENFIMILPKFVDISELALLFSDIHKKNPQ